jgi:hypothetical protein
MSLQGYPKSPDQHSARTEPLATPAAMVDQALHLASLGYHVLPLHTVQDGRCTCRKDDCKPGKHPNTDLVPHGSADATTDPAIIRQWWALWPDSNIGFNPEKSGVVVVGPECAMRCEEFAARNRRTGVADTLRVQSQSGPGHEHWHYRRTPDCPTININVPDDYDIIATGNMVAPGSVAHGPYLALNELRPVADLAPVPNWVVAMLRGKAEERERKQSLAVASSEDPPVAGEDVRRLWTGERMPSDRSGYLFALAKELYKAGLINPHYIAQALRDRDVAHGLNKYTGRSDAATRPLDDALAAIASVEEERATTGATHPARTDCGDGSVADLRRIHELEQLLAARDATIARLRRRLAMRDDEQEVRANQSIKAERDVIVVLAHAVDTLQQREQRRARAEQREPSREVKIPPLRVLAERAGCSEGKVSRVMARLEGWDTLKKRCATTLKPQRVNTGTGEILHAGYVTETYVELPADPLDWMTGFKDYEPDRFDPEIGRDRTHGGDRRCSKHPHAAVTVTETCSVCGDVLRVSRRKPAEKPMQTANCNMQEATDTPTVDTVEARRGHQTAIGPHVPVAETDAAIDAYLADRAAEPDPEPLTPGRLHHAIGLADAENTSLVHRCKGCGNQLPNPAARAAGYHPECQPRPADTRTTLLFAAAGGDD